MLPNFFCPKHSLFSTAAHPFDFRYPCPFIPVMDKVSGGASTLSTSYRRQHYLHDSLRCYPRHPTPTRLVGSGPDLLHMTGPAGGPSQSAPVSHTGPRRGPRDSDTASHPGRPRTTWTRLDSDGKAHTVRKNCLGDGEGLTGVGLRRKGRGRLAPWGSATKRAGGPVPTKAVAPLPSLTLH